MRKVWAPVSSIFFLIFLLGFNVSGVWAQIDGAAGAAVDLINPDSGVSRILPPPTSEPGFLGQDHKYSVVFRGNGEAVVSARIAFTNKTDSNLSEIALRVEKVEPKNLSVYQVLYEPTCIRYKESPVTIQIYPRPTPECAEYQEPDYYNYYYGNAKYQKAKFEYKGDALIITLPKAVSANKQGAFFVYFRALGYAKKDLLGAYNYVFETLKVDDDIRSLTVGISTDSDLFLKGIVGEVSYRFSEPTFAGLDAAGGVAEKSAALDSFYATIGQGKIVKTASNLSPLESYEVKGAYAKSRIRLYGKEMAIGATIFLFVVLFVIGVLKLVFHLVKKSEKQSEGTVKKSEGFGSNASFMVASLATSFISSLLITGYTIGIVILGVFLMYSVSYQYQSVLVLFLVVISFCVYAVLIFAPGLFFGVKKGIGWGITTVTATIFWLFIFLGIGILVLFFLGGGLESPVIPLMEKQIY